jgi:deoxyribose-phosphate aldolase
MAALVYGSSSKRLEEDAMSGSNEEVAQQMIGLLELTSLHGDDTAERIVTLCRRGLTPFGSVAAVCVLPRFVGLARRTLDREQGHEISVVATVNFPGGARSAQSVESETRLALMAGADEIDLVYPFRMQMAVGDCAGTDVVTACREACDGQARLTVTLETGVLSDPQVIHDVCRHVIAFGPAFIKTSTGKAVVNATPQALRIMIEAIAEAGGQVGLKACGGVRTLQEATLYLEMARARFGAAWLQSGRMRIGATSLLDDLLLHLGLWE